MQIVAITAMLCSIGLQGETLDRIAVSVDRQVITESQILLDRRVTAFIDGIPVDLSVEAKKKSAERLIDQLLILSDAAESRIKLPTKENAEVLVQQMKDQRGSEAAYRQDLKQYGITEADLTAHLLSGLIAYTFSELRFRPSVQVSDDEIAAYYNKVTDGAVIEARREDIEELLMRQRTEDALNAWLKTARGAARIQYREAVFQ